VSKLRSPGSEAEILKLVRDGVERFILRKATVEDFFRTIRAVTENEKLYSHQLTRSVFSRIVKEAIRKRKLKTSSYPQ
jgi:DNA-binding NarL/FixJ family response regulator